MTKELAKLISRTAPNSIKSLTASHPDATKLFGTETTRSGDSPVAALTDEGRIAAMIDLLLTGLKPLRTELDGVLVYVLNKMKWVKRITLIGAVIAALSGLILALAPVLGFADDVNKVLVAFFATVGGLVVIGSDYFQMAPSGRRIASAEEYGKISQMEFELKMIESRAGRHELFPLSAQEVEQMIEQTESYAAHVNGLRIR